ncbi:hypothetical protein LX73_0583 [Fodinibius salinus]|uniref:Regulator of microtubule dynamics protein 1 n=1 Tax=Fodinibius salinus TaxID=860790 RepID=A0A5D3YMA7_9BACT|nr:hypothetical protein [Fodinibius salinus]TYP95285.1 hypothetical protein LX73_0583 [Fodinibius salinus]
MISIKTEKKVYKSGVSLALFFFLISVSVSAQDNLSQQMNRADSLYNAYEDEEALQIYQNVLEGDPQNFTALWRSSFLYARISNQFNDKDKKRKYFDNALEFAKRALEVDSTHTQSNFVMAVALGRKALTAGVKERIAVSRKIKHYAEQAIKYDSTNAGAWHALGRWHYKAANLSWLERTAANTLFGGIPGDPSNKKAAHYIRKAIQHDGQFILYHRHLAAVYNKLGWEKEAIASCQRALELPVQRAEDKFLKDECHSLINNLQ